MNDSLRLLVNFIISKYFINSYCLTIISETPHVIISNEDEWTIPVLHYSLNRSDTIELNDFLLKSLSLGCSDYLTRMSDPGSFLDLYDESIHLSNQRSGDRKIVFLPTGNTEGNRLKFEDILSYDALNFLPNVLLVLPLLKYEDNSCISYELGTHTFYGKSNNSAIKILDKWFCNNSTLKYGSNLFPDKLSNLKGRIMKVATFKYKPYAILEFDENNQVVNYDGTEMRTAIEFCRWSNCELEVIRDDEHEWGEIWDNRTGNGIIGNIVMDKADFGFGALYSWYHEYQYLDFSIPVVRTGITCIAPAPQLLASYLLPVLPFNKVMWASVFASLMYSSIGVYLTGRAQKKSPSIATSILRVIGIIVLQNPSDKHPSNGMRHVINLLFIFSLMLSNAYSSGLASTITVPIYEAPIDKVQDLVDSNLDWGATHDAWIFSILEATEPQMVHLVSRFKKWSHEKLESKGKTRDFAYSIERLPAGHYAIGEYVTEDSVPYLQLMSQDIYFEYCVLMARKSSPYTQRLNKLIGILHQSGLLHAWETQVVLKYSDYTVQLGVHISQGKQSNPGPHPLNVKQLEGPMFLWGLGAMLSFIVFLAEIAMNMKKKMKDLTKTEENSMST